MSRNLEELFAAADGLAEEDGIGFFLRQAPVWLVGYSGGGDSSFLLRWCARRAAEWGKTVVAVHLHHGIRGDEADRDLAFCRETCRAVGIPLEEGFADVPALAEATRTSLETAARNVRYDLFRRVAAAYPGAVLLTAHTADDQLETVLERLLRGAGTRGLGGIAPVRTGEPTVLRPLLRLSGDEMRRALDDAGVPYVFDSTNGDERMSRNYLRQTVVPALRRLSVDPAAMAGRSAALCRLDEDCLDGLARDAVGEGTSVAIDTLCSLHEAVASRVIRLLAGRVSPEGMKDVEQRHVAAILRAARRGEPLTIALPLGRLAKVDPRRGLVTLARQKEPATPEPFEWLLPMGEAVEAGGFRIYRDTEPHFAPENGNINKLSIQRCIGFDTIKEPLSVRSRRPGDVYRLGGMTRRVKKLLWESEWSAEERWRLPLICQGDRILWIPGFPPSDDAVGDGTAYLTVLRITT